MTQNSENNICNLTDRVKATGCAAKISASQLSAIVRTLPQFASPQLLTSIESFEDAAVYKLSEELALVQTIDFFPPVVDDPYTFGCVAAANALSDIYAMGATPTLALNVLGFPICDFPLEIAQRILEGGAHVVQQAGALLVGGHSIQSTDLIYGLAVSGFVHPDRILINAGAQAGDRIILCKAIGTGVALLGLKGGMLSEPSHVQLLASLTQLNAGASRVALAHDTHACTDVSGFGLIGHLHEMAKGSGLQAFISARSVPLLPQAWELASIGLVPAGTYANLTSYKEIASVDESIDLSVSDLLFDPQTSGGLMLAVPEREVDSILKALAQEEYTAAQIGEFRKAADPINSNLNLKGLVEVK